MNKTLQIFLCGVMLLAVTPLFAGSRQSAYLAQKLIGPSIWTRVVHIQTTPAENSCYPEEFYGLVVAFADMLWFYTEFDGTQNLSVRRGQLDADKLNWKELLRDAVPNLVGAELEFDYLSSWDPSAPLPNACFVACIKYWQRLQQFESPPKNCRLIACFPSDSPSGHMILEYRVGLTRVVFDPDRPDKKIIVPFWTGSSPAKIAARAMKNRWPQPPARVLPFELGSPLQPSARLSIATGEVPDKARLSGYAGRATSD